MEGYISNILVNATVATGNSLASRFMKRGAVGKRPEEREIAPFMEPVEEIPENINPDWMNEPKQQDFCSETMPHDRILVVEGRQFFVQSQILSQDSKFFDRFFHGNMKDAAKEKNFLNEIRAVDLENFLSVIYSRTQKVNELNLNSLIVGSFCFLAPQVLEMCREYINNNFEHLDKIELLETTFGYEFDNLKTRIALHLKKQMLLAYRSNNKSDAIKLLLRDNPKIRNLSMELKAFLFDVLFDLDK